jgi:hypothetical protein
MDYPQKLAQLLSRPSTPSFDLDATNRAAQYQAMADGAPTGAVGAPGGILPYEPPRQAPSSFQDYAGAASFFPGIGDAAGLMGDASMYATDPSSRTPGNYALSAAGLLPFVPAAGVLKQINEDLWRGGRTINDGQFFSRDVDYAKGMAKGHFGKYRVTAQKALDFNQPLSVEETAQIVKALRGYKEQKAADMIMGAAEEDGGVLPGHLYMWLEQMAKNAPEVYFKKAGIDAIDTGRDVRLLNKNGAQPYSN